MTTPITSPPFGRDTSCTTQLRYGVIVSGDKLLAEAAFRRLNTDRGSLEDVANPDEAANYGLPLNKLLNHGMTTAQQLAAQSQIVNELRKDPRVDSVDVVITKTDNKSWSVDINLFGLEGVQASLALSVNDVTVEILGGAT